jgi:segregation and condensation protein A
MLLPVHEEGGEDEDPRQDLVRQLLEHQKYREASEALEERLRERSLLFSREPAANPPLKEEVFMDVTLFQLLQAFREIMSRAAEGQSLLIPPDQWSVADKMRDIMALLEQRPDLIFTQAFPPGAPRGEIIACFLAILELVKLQMIHLFQRESGGEIYLARSVA